MRIQNDTRIIGDSEFVEIGLGGVIMPTLHAVARFKSHFHRSLVVLAWEFEGAD